MKRVLSGLLVFALACGSGLAAELRFNNSGRNCIVAALSRLQTSVNRSDLASAFSDDEYAVANTNIDTIFSYLESKGLRCTPVKNGGFTKLVSSVAEGSACIIQTDRINKFIFVLNTSQGVMVDDYPNVGQIISLSEFVDRFSEKYDGQYLIVEKDGLGGRVRSPLPAAEILSKKTGPVNNAVVPVQIMEGELYRANGSVDLGEFSRSCEFTSAKFKIENTGDRILLINNIKGDCSCFTGMDGKKSIDPKTTAEINLKFNPSIKKYADVFETSIVFETNDQKQPLLLVKARGVFVDTTVAFLDNSSVDLGAVTRGSFAGKKIPVRVMATEGGFQVKKITLDSRALKIMRTPGFPGLPSVGIRPIYTGDLIFDVSEEATGPVSHLVTFNLVGERKQTLNLRVKYELLD